MPKARSQATGGLQHDAIEAIGPRLFLCQAEVLTPMLGGTSMDPDVYCAYQQSAARDQGVPPYLLLEERDTIPLISEFTGLTQLDVITGDSTKLVDLIMAEETKEDAGGDEENVPPERLTGFHRIVTERDGFGNPTQWGPPFLYDYVFTGALTSACGALWRTPGSAIHKMPGYKKKLRQHVFPYPREIVMTLPPDGREMINRRQLRAETAQGPRVSIAHSVQVPAGTQFQFVLEMFGAVYPVEVLPEISLFWSRHGLGQWRNHGWGRIATRWTEIPADHQAYRAWLNYTTGQARYLYLRPPGDENEFVLPSDLRGSMPRTAIGVTQQSKA